MKDSPKTNCQTFLRWAGTIFSLILLVVLFYIYREDLLAAVRRGVVPVNLLMAAGFIFLSRLMTVARWYTLLRSGGIKISFKDTASLTFTGLFASNFLPTTVGGDVVRLAGAMQMGYDRAVCLASIAADRLINMTGMSLAAPLGLFQLFTVGPLVLGSLELAPGMLGVQSLSLAGLWEKGWDFIRRTLASLTIWLKQPLVLLQALAFALGNLLCVAGSYYLLIQGMGEYLPYWKVVGLVSMGYFIGLMPFSINGYGWHEVSVTALFSQIGGVSVAVCGVVVLIQRVLMMLASAPGAFTLPAIMAKMREEQRVKVDA